ncbi:MAG: pantoate--beta-alanine ligase [Bacteroidetes bacterium]|nr:pantoate--beta-alanine ligase [Bacteroidota bacterium]
MKVFTLASELKSIQQENPTQKIAFIPTMGALHQGHLSLVRASQQEDCLTVVSIFVNPLQFKNPLDLDKYPRTLDADLQELANVGTDIVFTPTVEEMYPPQVENVVVDLGSLDEKFEGAFRPGHFHGVVQVVYRLFKYVQPQVVYFGEKDLQQCLVIEQLIQQVFPTIQMRRIATMRESSGLAMSSRNVRLSDEGRKTAPALYQSLLQIIENRKSLCSAVATETERLTQLGFDVEYLSCVSLPYLDDVPCDFFASIIDDSPRPKCAVLVAASLDGVRLIDNQVF